MTSNAKAWTIFGSIAGIVIGGFLGKQFPDIFTALGFVGDTFVGGLTVLSMMAAVTYLFNAVTGLGDFSKFRLAFFKNLGFWGLTAVLALGVALGVSTIFSGYGSSAIGATGDVNLGGMRFASSPALWLGMILVTIIFGLSATQLRSKVRSLVSWFRNLSDALDQMVAFVVLIMPVGLMFVAANMVARDGYRIGSLSQPVGAFLLSVVVGLGLFGLVIFPALIALIGKTNPLVIYGRVLSGIVVALGTFSSRLALPYVITGLSTNKQADERATGLAVGLGSALNVGPTMIVVILAASFLGSASGHPLAIYQLLLVGLIATVLSIGIGSAAGAAIPLTFTALALAGQTADFTPALYIVVGAAWLIEPLRAVVTTLGDAAGAAVLTEAFEFKTALRSPTRTAPRRYDGRPERPERRGGKRPDRDSRGRTGRPDSSRDSSNRSRTPDRSSGRPPERTPDRSTDRPADRSANRRGPQSFTRGGRDNQASSTGRPDDRGRSGRDANNRTRPERPTEKTEPVVDSPFAMKSADPALEIQGAPTVRPETNESRTEQSPSRGSERRDPRRDDRRPSDSRERRRPDSRPARDTNRRETTPASPSMADDSRKADNRPTSDKPEPTEKPTGNSLTRDKIQDELARVSKQLMSMDQRLPDESSSAPVESPAPKSAASPETPPRHERENRPETKPEPKSEVIEKPEPKAEQKPDRTERLTETPPIASEPETSKGEPAEKPSSITDEEKKLAAGFGRSRDRRAPRQREPKADQADSSEKTEKPEKTEKAEPSKSSDSGSNDSATVEPSNSPDEKREIEFGRTKRKRKSR